MAKTSHKSHVGLADLPPDVFALILNHLRKPFKRPNDTTVGDLDCMNRYGYGQARLANLLTVSKGVYKLVAPLLYNRVQPIDLLHVLLGFDDKGVKGCFSKRELCGMIRYLHLEYGCRAPDAFALFDKGAKKEMARIIGGRDQSDLFPGLEWITYARLEWQTSGFDVDYIPCWTAGLPGALDILAPKHACVWTSYVLINNNRNRIKQMWPVNIPTHYQVGSKEYKTAFEDTLEITKTLTVHLNDQSRNKKALPISLPNGITRYLVPLALCEPANVIRFFRRDTSCVSSIIRGNELGEWMFDLIRPKVFPGDQYSFEFYIQCPPASTEFGQRYRERIEGRLQEWLEKAEEREVAWYQRAKVPDEEWTPLVINYELVDELPCCEGYCR